jgi:hypothetical protein
MRAFLISALIGATSLAAPAQAWVASNGFVVQPIDALHFQVNSRGRLGPTNAWCAAGDYVIKNLGLPYPTMIWRASPPPQAGGAPIVFTLDPSDQRYDTGLAQIGNKSGGVSASLAQQLCWVGSSRGYRD